MRGRGSGVGGHNWTASLRAAVWWLRWSCSVWRGAFPLTVWVVGRSALSLAIITFGWSLVGRNMCGLGPLQNHHTSSGRNYAAVNLCSSRRPPQQDKQSLWAWKGGREEADGSRQKLPRLGTFPLCLVVKPVLLTEVFQQLVEATARAVWVYQNTQTSLGDASELWNFIAQFGKRNSYLRHPILAVWDAT